ncbi:MAG: CRISPR-associated protein Cas4 [Firmicutes bacterium]|nr:CRISPR-associated protein Cas4 [Bacillota bacterium]
MKYEEEDLLPLSGIQHFAFCERQWGLIHVENQWVENLRTAEGRLLHERVDDPYFTESRGEVRIIRSVPLQSRSLGLFGIADVLEIHRNQDGQSSSAYSIVEYKRGKPKPDDRDEVQLCAQAICLEEMLGMTLVYGYMYYGETRHRHRVEFNDQLRTRVKILADKMHLLFAHGITPPTVKGSHCKNCSMKDVCLPKLGGSGKKVEIYMATIVEGMISE